MQKNDNITMAGIGERLKDAREKKGLTIDQAQKQTRINSAVLIALEDGKCDEMLTQTYVRSFLKKYASYLGIDAKEIAGEYDLIHPNPAAQNIIKKEETNNAPDTAKGIYIALFAIFFLASVFLLVFLGKKAVDYMKSRRPSPTIRVTRHKAVPLREVKANISNKSISKPVASAPAAVQSAPEKKTPIKLTVKVKQSVLLQLKKDGVTLFKRVLPKGTTETFVADNRIDIYVAKGEAIELTLDGNPMGSPGRGVIKDLEITHKGVKIK